jgi:hypothetical protein
MYRLKIRSCIAVRFFLSILGDSEIASLQVWVVRIFEVF